MGRTRLLARCLAPVAVAALTVAVAAGAGAAPVKAPSQAKSDVIIGNISNATGSGIPSDGAFKTLQAWAKDVNSRGGVNGHKIVVKTADDKADPAKAPEAMKSLIDAVRSRSWASTRVGRRRCGCRSPTTPRFRPSVVVATASTRLATRTTSA